MPILPNDLLCPRFSEAAEMMMPNDIEGIDDAPLVELDTERLLIRIKNFTNTINEQNATCSGLEIFENYKVGDRIPIIIDGESIKDLSKLSGDREQARKAIYNHGGITIGYMTLTEVNVDVKAGNVEIYGKPLITEMLGDIVHTLENNLKLYNFILTCTILSKQYQHSVLVEWEWAYKAVTDVLLSLAGEWHQEEKGNA